MTSAVNAYSQFDNIMISGTTMTADERQQEIFQQVKTCFETENVRVIQSKNYDVIKEWWLSEAKNHQRMITLRLNKETGVYIAVSQPNKNSNQTKKERKQEFKEERKSKEKPEWSKILEKAETCLAKENILVIETKDAEILQMWIKEDEEGRNISTNKNETTGVYTAISSPKTDGNGKVMFRKID